MGVKLEMARGRIGINRRFHKPALRLGVLFLLLAAASSACTDTAPVAEPPYLLRVGDDMVTVLEYERAFELAKIAYPHRILQDPEAERAIRLRVLREMTEELILRQRARELGLSVTTEELQEAEKKIRSDYPEGAFEETLLESAVSYGAWKEKLRSRLLIEKVIRQDLENGIQISAQDVAGYYETRQKTLGESAENERRPFSREADERIVDDLRRKKAEAAYAGWIEDLREKYLIDINVSQWRRITES
jgi:hypothetical protein